MRRSIAITWSLVLMAALTRAAALEGDAAHDGDAARGRRLFAPCRTCHYPEKGYGNHNGPSLFAIFGRRAGTREGFLYYSDALKRSNLIWTPELLNTWLANPKTFLPGTSMVFVGLDCAQDRADLIAYLAQFRDP
jgi:cytochrome c